MSTCDAQQHVVYIVRVIKKTRPYPKYPRISIPDLWYEVHAIVFEEHIGPNSGFGLGWYAHLEEMFAHIYVEDYDINFYTFFEFLRISDVGQIPL